MLIFYIWRWTCISGGIMAAFQAASCYIAGYLNKAIWNLRNLCKAIFCQTQIHVFVHVFVENSKNSNTRYFACEASPFSCYKLEYLDNMVYIKMIIIIKCAIIDNFNEITRCNHNIFIPLWSWRKSFEYDVCSHLEFRYSNLGGFGLL